MSSSQLLINEHPLQVLPSLAVAIGLNEAIMVQQIHYWLNNKDKRSKPYISEGKKWVYNSYQDWQEQFPFWSLSTIKRTALRAENLGVLRSAQFDLLQGDAKKYYTIEYAKLDRILDQTDTPPSAQVDLTPIGSSCPPPSAQVDPPIGSSWSHLPCSLSETTSETTFENYLKADNSLERVSLFPSKTEPIVDEKSEMVTPVSLPSITESEAVIQEYPPTPHTQGTGTGVGTALHVGVVAAGTGTGVDDEFQLQADFEAGKPASENGKGKVALPPSKKAGRPVSASKNGIPQSDHQRLMAAQVEITGQPILNGSALGKAIKTILGAYTVDQAIECLRWMAEPSTNWKGSVNWLAVQNYIGEYFRRQNQLQLKTNGGLNDKDVRGNLSGTKAETKADRSWITRQKWFQERFGDNTKVA